MRHQICRSGEKKRLIAGPKSHRDLFSEKAAEDSPREEGSRFDYTKDFARLKQLDNTSNISAKRIKKSLTPWQTRKRSRRADHSKHSKIRPHLWKRLCHLHRLWQSPPIVYHQGHVADPMHPHSRPHERQRMLATHHRRTVTKCCEPCSWPYDRTLPGCLKVQQKNYCK